MPGACDCLIHNLTHSCNSTLAYLDGFQREWQLGVVHTCCAVWPTTWLQTCVVLCVCRVYNTARLCCSSHEVYKLRSYATRFSKSFSSLFRTPFFSYRLEVHSRRKRLGRKRLGKKEGNVSNKSLIQFTLTKALFDTLFHISTYYTL